MRACPFRTRVNDVSARRNLLQCGYRIDRSAWMLSVSWSISWFRLFNLLRDFMISGVSSVFCRVTFVFTCFDVWKSRLVTENVNHQKAMHDSINKKCVHKYVFGDPLYMCNSRFFGRTSNFDFLSKFSAICAKNMWLQLRIYYKSLYHLREGANIEKATAKTVIWSVRSINQLEFLRYVNTRLFLLHGLHDFTLNKWSSSN